MILSPGFSEIFGFLGKLGLISLLFRVGLESNLLGLLKQLRRASVIWSADVMFSGLVGFATAFYILGLAWMTSLIVAVAFTATSVGISVAVWEEAGSLNSENGELLIDVAELDDISAVVLMALLFSFVPLLKNAPDINLLPIAAKTLGLFSIKFLGFGLFCYLFSRYAERPLTSRLKSVEPPPSLMLVVVAIGFIIAAMADLLGFSMAIGAFFAGLVFSRNPEAVKVEASFVPLYEMFSPFFFIGIGLDMDPGSLINAAGLGSVLLIMAVLSKVFANGIPVWLMGSYKSAVLIGLSMVPRAEIAMVIMHRGYSIGDNVIPPEVYGAIVFVSMGTCLISPFVVSPLLKKWKEEMASLSSR
jgi:Kef-type K+ transport system membrane component KefB